MSANDETIERLLTLAKPRLWRAYLSARGIDGADEATAEALAWGWENGDQLSTLSNPTGYLYRVGLSQTRQRRKQPTLPEPETVGLPQVEPALIPALQGLPETQRTAVWLVHGCQWSYAEVAEAMGVGTSTVGTHVSRALATLRTELKVTDNA